MFSGDSPAQLKALNVFAPTSATNPSLVQLDLRNIDTGTGTIIVPQLGTNKPSIFSHYVGTSSIASMLDKGKEAKVAAYDSDRIGCVVTTRTAS